MLESPAPHTDKNIKNKVILSWSSGKDSAWTLHALSRQPELEVCGLLTTLNERYQRIAMHGVRETLLQVQAQSVGLPLVTIPLPDGCSNDEYEERMSVALSQLKESGISGIVFGDLFLQDVRQYRERQVHAQGLQTHFPLWGLETHRLAEQMIESGTRAILTCIDTKVLPREFAGREFDRDLLRDLPEGVDPCGENGEFHSFTYAGPSFHSSIKVERGEIVTNGDFVFTDLEGS